MGLTANQLIRLLSQLTPEQREDFAMAFYCPNCEECFTLGRIQVVSRNGEFSDIYDANTPVLRALDD